jgi:hypothetical protein
MSDWTLYDSTGPVRTGLTRDEAVELVDLNRGDDENNLDVYALGPGGERYPTD